MYSLNTLAYNWDYLFVYLFILPVCHLLQIMYIFCDLIYNIITYSIYK